MTRDGARVQRSPRSGGNAVLRLFSPTLTGARRADRVQPSPRSGGNAVLRLFAPTWTDRMVLDMIEGQSMPEGHREADGSAYSSSGLPPGSAMSAPRGDLYGKRTEAHVLARMLHQCDLRSWKRRKMPAHGLGYGAPTGGTPGIATWPRFTGKHNRRNLPNRRRTPARP